MIDYLSLRFRREPVVIVGHVQGEPRFRLQKRVDPPRLVHARHDIGGGGLIVKLRRHDQRGPRGDGGQDLVKVVRKPRLLARERAQPRQQRQPVAPAGQAARPLGNRVQAHRGEAPHRDRARDPVVQGRGVEGGHATRAVAGDEDSGRVDEQRAFESVDRRPDLLHHAPHEGPARIPQIESACLLDATAVADLVERQHGETGLRHAYGEGLAPRKHLGVSGGGREGMKPDHGGQFRAREVGPRGKVEVAGNVIPERNAAFGHAHGNLVPMHQRGRGRGFGAEAIGAAVRPGRGDAQTPAHAGQDLAPPGFPFVRRGHGVATPRDQQALQRLLGILPRVDLFLAEAQPIRVSWEQPAIPHFQGASGEPRIQPIEVILNILRPGLVSSLPVQEGGIPWRV